MLPPCIISVDKDSYGYNALVVNIPTILRSVIKNLQNQPGKYSAVIEKIEETIKSLVNNELVPDICDNFSDNDHYKKYKEILGKNKTWQEVPRLYAECVLYRKIYEIFLNEKIDLDYFSFLKVENFVSNVSYISQYIKPFDDYLKEKNHFLNETTTEGILKKLLQLCVWGNKGDLSLTVGQSNEQNEKTTTNTDINATLKEQYQQYMVLDDSDAAIHHLKKDCSHKKNVSIVLDNFGIDFCADLPLILFLLLEPSLNVHTVLIHPKSFPWLVSDVTLADIDLTLNLLQQHVSPHIKNHFDTLLNAKRIIICPNTYWTLPYSYQDMHLIAPDLYSTLAASHLTIFKGDLNYRKTSEDRLWHFNTPFLTVLRDFNPSSMLFLKTSKVETLAGLPDTLTNGDFFKNLPNHFLNTGEYGFIQFYSKD